MNPGGKETIPVSRRHQGEGTAITRRRSGFGLGQEKIFARPRGSKQKSEKVTRADIHLQKMVKKQKERAAPKGEVTGWSMQ